MTTKIKALLAALIVGAVALAMVPPSAQAETAPSPLADARTQLESCQRMRAEARNAEQRAWGNTCITLAQRVVDRLTVTPSPSPTTPPPSTPTPSPSSTTPAPSPTSPSPSPTTPSGWPGPDNTGVPAGTTLTTYSGPCTITAANTVIDAKYVNCRLTIQTTGVRITRSRVLGGVDNGTRAESSFRIEDSEVIAATDQTAVGEVHYTVIRSNLWGGNRQAHCYAHCVIEDSWLHGTRFTGTNHASGVRFGQWTTLRHNTIACDAPDNAVEGGCSAAITGYPEWTAVHHVTVADSLIVWTPGGYCAYGGWETDKVHNADADNATYIVYTGNVFQRGPTGRCGWWGPITSYRTDRTGNVWSGNTWDTGGTVTP